MSDSPILFQFPDAKSAKIALDTLLELNYHAHLAEREKKPTIHIFVDQNDLTSALEIAQANGGCLTASALNDREEDYYNTAYRIDNVPIPAHLINEDWVEEGKENDWDDENYANFPAGIRF